jgi:hypothetical protein
VRKEKRDEGRLDYIVWVTAGAPSRVVRRGYFFYFFHPNLKSQKSPVSVFQMTNPFFLQTAIGRRIRIGNFA